MRCRCSSFLQVSWIFSVSLLALSAQRAAAQTTPELRSSRVLIADTAGERGEPPVITALALHPLERQVATAGDDHTVRIWNLDTGRLIHRLRGHSDWVRTLAYRPDGTMLASSGDDGQITLWDLPAGRESHKLASNAPSISRLVFTPDGQTLAAVGFDNKLRICDGGSGQLLRSLDCPCRDMRALVVSKDGQLMAGAGRNGRIRLWGSMDGQVQRQWQSPDHLIRGLAFSPDGKQLASAGETGRIHVWDTATGQEIVSLPSRPGKMLCVVFCGPEMLAAGSTDNAIRLWNLPERRLAARLIGHTGSVAALAFDESAGTLVSSSFDATVRVWELKSSSIGTAREIDPSKPLR